LFLTVLTYSWNPHLSLSQPERIEEYRRTQVGVLTTGDDAPLWPEDKKDIHFFPYDTAYRVEAKVEWLENEKPFSMPTYSGASKDFIRSASLSFVINGTTHTLSAYKDLSIPPAMVVHRDRLFLPFMDHSNSEITYGGGRYLDIDLRRGSTSALIDFNRAYNPYCAYADGFRCPIPPRENRLGIEIPAGEQSYSGKRRTRGARP
jgi:uncharacterized protein (DUF1684 family)